MLDKVLLAEPGRWETCLENLKSILPERGWSAAVWDSMLDKVLLAEAGRSGTRWEDSILPKRGSSFALPHPPVLAETSRSRPYLMSAEITWYGVG